MFKTKVRLPDENTSVGLAVFLGLLFHVVLDLGHLVLYFALFGLEFFNLLFQSQSECLRQWPNAYSGYAAENSWKEPAIPVYQVGNMQEVRTSRTSNCSDGTCPAEG